MLRASGDGFEPGIYRATIVFQSQSAVPQYINVPVTFLLGASTSGTTISSVVNSYSFQSTVSPGMLLTILGSNLANTPQSTSGNPFPYSAEGVTAAVNGLAAPILYVSPTQLNIQVPYAVGAGPGVVGINNNGQIAGFSIQIAPTAPGIFSDALGNAAPNASAQPGATATIFLTGAGEVSPALKTAFAVPSPPIPGTQPKPVQPVSVTVGNVPAFVVNEALAVGLIGTTEVDFIVPPTVPAGVQPVVVTIGGVSSPPVNLTVQGP